MRERVLVEEEVEEGAVDLAHPRGRVDERHLSEHRRAVVEGELSLHLVLAGARAGIHDSAGRELELEALHDRARPEHERPGRPHGPLRPATVGGREDLLGGHVGHEAPPPLRHRLAAAPHRLRQEPDEQVGAGAAVAERVEPPFVERLAPPLQTLDVLFPRGDRIGLVEPDRIADQPPQSEQVRLAEHPPRPGLGRVRDHRPRNVIGVRAASDRLPELAPLRLRDPLTRQALRSLEIRREDVHERSTPLVQVFDVTDEPRWGEAEELVLRVEHL